MVELQVKELFFDKAPVIEAVGVKRANAMAKAGSYIKRDAKQSIRQRKRPSLPGQPPSSHRGDLKRLIFFAFDPTTESMLIGPEAFPSATTRIGPTIPEVLEEGGDVLLKGRKTAKGRKPARKIHIADRPYMGPALEKNEEAYLEGYGEDS